MCGTIVLANGWGPDFLRIFKDGWGGDHRLVRAIHLDGNCGFDRGVAPHFQVLHERNGGIANRSSKAPLPRMSSTRQALEQLAPRNQPYFPTHLPHPLPLISGNHNTSFHWFYRMEPEWDMALREKQRFPHAPHKVDPSEGSWPPKPNRKNRYLDEPPRHRGSSANKKILQLPILLLKWLMKGWLTGVEAKYDLSDLVAPDWGTCVKWLALFALANASLIVVALALNRAINWLEPPEAPIGRRRGGRQRKNKRYPKPQEGFSSYTFAKVNKWWELASSGLTHLLLGFKWGKQSSHVHSSRSLGLFAGGTHQTQGNQRPQAQQPSRISYTDRGLCLE